MEECNNNVGENTNSNSNNNNELQSAKHKLIEERSSETPKLDISSLLFPCARGSYGCDIISRQKSFPDSLDDGCSTCPSFDTNDIFHEERILRQVASWISINVDNQENVKPHDKQQSPNEVATKQVHFEKNPISSLKRVSKYTEEETQKLFYTDCELYQIDRDYNDRQDEIEVMMTSPSSPIAASKSCVDIQSPNSVAVIYTHSVSK